MNTPYRTKAELEMDNESLYTPAKEQPEQAPGFPLLSSLTMALAFEGAIYYFLQYTGTIVVFACLNVVAISGFFIWKASLEMNGYLERKKEREKKRVEDLNVELAKVVISSEYSFEKLQELVAKKYKHNVLSANDFAAWIHSKKP